jgi:hypothetical protein
MTVATEYPTREYTCTKHGHTWTQQQFFQVPEVWLPGCDECEKEERRLHQARENVSKREAEQRERVAERCKPNEEEIKRRTDTRIEGLAQAYLDELEASRARLDADIRRESWEEINQDVYDEMIAEEIEKLKGA